MKKIFPIITILISLSLLGLIFFQFLWIKSARDAKDKQVEEHIVFAIREAANTLSEDNNSIIPFGKKSDMLFPNDKLQLQYFKSSVMQRFSKEDINQIIRNAFNKNNLEKYPFEFAVVENTLSGRQLL
jgi:two-component system, OmpR family, phosphate regulon sensor histidine kinase PhoR